MSWRLELFSNTNATRVGAFALYRDAHAVRELEGEDSLSFVLSPDDSLYSSILERKYVRLVENENSSNYRSYIIQRLSDIRDEAGNLSLKVECEGLKYALMDNILPSLLAFSQIAASTALAEALSGSGFTAGTVNPTSTNLSDIEFNFLNSLEALQLITETWFYDDGGVRKRYYYRVNENKTVDILTLPNLGTQREFYIIFDKNLRSMSRDRDCQGMANRVYAVGAEGFSINRGAGINYDYGNDPALETASGGAATYLEDSDTLQITANDEHNGMQLKIVGGTGSGQKRTISDTILSTKRLVPSVNFSPAPNNTSTYLIGYADSGESMVYDLGACYADSNPLKRDSLLRIQWRNVAGWSSGSGTCTFKIQLSLLDDADKVLLSMIKTMAYTYPVDDVDDSETIEVGDVETATKIKLEVLSIAFTGGGAGLPFTQFNWMNYTLGINAIVIDDPTSQGIYGIVTGKYENPNIQDTINLINTPALDGTYTGGLCQDWTMEGTPTLTENTSAAYIHHGTKSQKVVADADAEGIEQSWYAVVADKAYSAYCRVYIDPDAPGSVKFSINLGGQIQYYVTTGVGWIEILIENFSFIYSGIATIGVLSSGGALTFYVDAVMVHEGSELHDFVDGDTADILWREGNNYLQQHKNPIVSYSLDLLDLYEHDRAKYAEENFLVGDAIRVVDPDLSIDTHLTVTRKEFDIDNPQNCKVGLGEKRLTWQKSIIGSMIKQIRLIG
jgi:phage minor structural protein